MVSILLWLLTFFALAEEIRISVPVDELIIGQIISLEIELIDFSIKEKPTMPRQNGLSLQYQGVSTLAVRKEGRYVPVMTHTYILTGEEVGEWKIGPVDFVHHGVKSNALPIKVLPRSQKNQNALELVSAPKGNLLYEGEPFVYTLRFVSRLRIYDVQWHYPKLDAFSSINGLEMQQVEYSITDKNHTEDVVEVGIPLLANQSGKYVISPAMVSAQVVVPASKSGGAYGLQAGMVQRSISSLPVEITIKKIPPPPEGYSGLVGEFELRADLQEKEILLGESVAQKIIVNGRGLISTVEFIEDRSDFFRIYNDQPVRSQRIKNGELYSQYDLHRAIVPRKEGVLTLDEITLIVFDTKEEQFVTLRSEPMVLTVKSGVEETQITRFEAAVDLQESSGVDIRSAPKDVLIDSHPEMGLYLLMIPGFLTILCLIQYFSDGLQRSWLQREIVPLDQRKRLQYTLKKLEEEMTENGQTIKANEENSNRQPELEQLRNEILAVLYGGQDVQNIEFKIKDFLEGGK